MDHDMMPVSGSVTIKYIKTTTSNFQIDPTNYNYMVDHINKTDKLHDLTISIDDIERIGREDFQNNPKITDESHIVAHVFKFNEFQYIMAYQFTVNGFVVGDILYKNNKLMKRDDRGEHLIKLENILNGNLGNE